MPTWVQVFHHVLFLPGGCQRGLLMENLILTLSCQSLLEIIWDVRGIRVASLYQMYSRHKAALPNPGCGAFADCCRVTSTFSPQFILKLWHRFWSSLWKTPNSTFLHSLWNEFSLFCSYSVCVTMDTAPKWFGLYMNLFISVTWSGLFFFCAAGVNIVS